MLDGVQHGKRDSRKIKPRKGPSPDILRKGGEHKDKSKYTRKEKYKHVHTEKD